MKKLAIVLITLILLCGCTAVKTPSEIDVGAFSYKADYTKYKDEAGVSLSGFVNTKEASPCTAEQVVAAAKREVTVEYDTITVDFDKDSQIYRVCFFKQEHLGGDQSVYITKNGITKMIVYGE